MENDFLLCSFSLDNIRETIKHIKRESVKTKLYFSVET